jgi:pSer/pThr/pTyr-binding forkhead associated (FHA) protein
MPFRIRYLAHDLELPVGDFVIGRGPECQLAVDDPLVSRKHAVLRVTGAGVLAQDLGSRNGVLINGVKLDGSRDIVPGDKIRIGNQEIVVYKTDDARTITQTAACSNPIVSSSPNMIFIFCTA